MRLGNLYAFNALLSKETTDINLTNRDGYRPIHIASLYDRVEMRSTLLKCKNALTIDEDDITVVHAAAGSKKIDCVMGLLGRDEFSITDTDRYGNTILHHAARYDNYPLLFKLLDEDVSDIINATNHNGDTFLHILGAFACHDKMEEILKDESIDVNIANLDGNTPLHLAVFKKDESKIDVLLARCDIKPNKLNGSGDAPLHIAAWQDEIEPTRSLFHSKKIDVNIRDRHMNTPLHHALERSLYNGPDEFALELLGRKDIDITLENKEGVAPLEYAMQSCRESITDVILEKIMKAACQEEEKHSNLPQHSLFGSGSPKRQREGHSDLSDEEECKRSRYQL